MEKLARQSNFELLRIIVMVMIAYSHTTLIPDNLEWLHSGGGDSVTGVLNMFLSAICVPNVDVFVILSGFFSIKWKAKKVISLCFQVYFWTFLVYLSLITLGVIDFQFKPCVKHLNALLYEYWFIPQYLLLYLFAPLLNTFVENTNRKDLAFFISIYYIVQSYWGLFCQQPFGAGYSVASFIGLYLVGRYLKKYVSNDVTIRRSKIIFMLIGLYALNTILQIIEIGVHNSANIVMQYNSPLVVFEAILTVMLFNTFEFSSRIVNWCSSSVLAVYLLHMQLELRPIYMDYGKSLYELPVLDHVFRLFYLISVLFVFAILMDKFRIYMFEKIYNIFTKKRYITRE